MTSKNLFFKLMGENLKRRSWFVSLCLLIFFFLFPVGSAFSAAVGLDPDSFAYATDPKLALANAKKMLYQSFLQWQSPDNSFLLFLLFCLAIVAGCSGFSYLQSRKKTDFYHSLPVSRGCLFHVVNVNSLLIVSLSYVVMALASALIIQFYSGYRDCVAVALRSSAVHLLFFFLAYSFAVLAAMLTGHALVCILGFAVLLFWGPFVIQLFSALSSTWFHTYYEDSARIAQLYQYSSPFLLGLNISALTLARRLAVALALGSAVLALAYFLYRLRKSEAAGRAMSFRLTEAPIRWLLVIPAALGCSVVTYIALNSDFCAVFALICGLAVFHCLIEIIYHFDFKKLFSHSLQLLACGAVAFTILLFFRLDLGGYDLWVPEESEVESVGFFSSDLEAELYQYQAKIVLKEDGGRLYPHMEEGKNALDVVRDMRLEQITPAISIASQGAENAAKLRGRDSYAPEELLSDGTSRRVIISNVLIFWHLKDGRTAIRTYQINAGKDPVSIESLLDDPAYKQAVYPLFSIPEETIAGANYEDCTGVHHVPLPRGREAELFSAYRKEFLELTAGEQRRESPVACIQFKTRDFQQMADQIRAQGDSISSFNHVGYYPVYPSFHETIALLRRSGSPRIQLNPVLTPNSIASIDVRDERYTSKNPTAAVLTVTDVGQIQQILDSSINRALSCTNRLHPGFYGVSITVHLKDSAAQQWMNREYEDENSSVRDLILDRDKIPYFIRDYFDLDGETVDEYSDSFF